VKILSNDDFNYFEKMSKENRYTYNGTEAEFVIDALMRWAPMGEAAAVEIRSAATYHEWLFGVSFWIGAPYIMHVYPTANGFGSVFIDIRKPAEFRAKTSLSDEEWAPFEDPAKYQAERSPARDAKDFSRRFKEKDGTLSFVKTMEPEKQRSAVEQIISTFKKKKA